MSRVPSQLLMSCLLMLSSVSSVQANDIEDFFRSLRGGSHRERHGTPVTAVGHERSHGQRSPLLAQRGHAGHNHQMLGSRDLHTRQQLAEQYGRHPAFDHQRYDLRPQYDGRHRHHVGGSGLRHSLPVTGRTGTHLSFQISSGSPTLYGGTLDTPVMPPLVVPQYPMVPQYPAAPVIPVQPHITALPHQLGEIVTCAVPLATCVTIEDPQNIAPHAVPVVVAVRDPHLPPYHTGCVDRLVYVEVCVPSCPLRGLTISPCHTRIKMDYGDYEVDIRSTNGRIVVDYDN